MTDLVELAKRLDFIAEVSDGGRKPDPSSVTRRSAKAMRLAQARIEADAARLEKAREALQTTWDALGEMTVPKGHPLLAASVKAREALKELSHDR